MMKRLMFAVLMSAFSSLAAETSQDRTGTDNATQSAGKPIEKPATGAERANCADWNTHRFFASAVPEDISSCLSEGADPNTKDEYGRTPLGQAVGYAINANANAKDAVAVVQALIVEGADPNTKDEYGRTLLGQAVGYAINPNANAKDAVAVVQALIVAGADPNATDNSERTILGKALTTSRWDVDANLALIQALLAAGADPKALTGIADMWRPLHMAVLYSQNPGVAQALIVAGADLNAKAKGGRTPLHMVGNVAVAHVLIAAGADLNARDKYGKTPLHVAVGAVTQALIAAGADPNDRDNTGKIPLHFSANGTTAEVLLAAGANWKARDENGRTPLHTAASNARHDHKELIGVLVDAGSDPNVRDAAGRTPLHVFALGADTNLRLRDAPELLDEIVKPLVARGAEVDARDGEGITPLHLAATSDRMGNLVMALLDAGANGSLQNSRDETPWDLARGNEWLDNAFRRSRGLPETEAYWRLNDARFEGPTEAP